MQSSITTEKKPPYSGFLITFCAFLAWGTLPLYWQKMFGLPFWGITSYRIASSWMFVIIVITLTRQWNTVYRLLSDRRTVGFLIICGFLIGVNWSVYMISISSGHVIEASMGYYINPLMNALFGAVFFREKLRLLQKVSLLAAVTGVTYMIAGYGSFPVYAFLLALSFALYGAVHKLINVKLMNGMFFEMSVLIIPAVLYLSYAVHSGLIPSFINERPSMQLIIALAGPFTALPLMGFAVGVKKLSLTTVGIIQYVSPTSTFLMGIFYFKEGFSREMLIVFSFIWLGVVIYLADALLHHFKRRHLTAIYRK